MTTSSVDTKKLPSPLQMALVPGAVTLGVTLVRFAGERTGGPAILFGRAEGGAAALVGILWLAFLFGGCFGFRLRAFDQGSSSLVRRLCTVVTGALLAVAVVAVSVAAGAVTMPGTMDADGNPITPSGLPYVLLAAALPAIAAWLAWPQLARTLLVYAVLARLPIIVLTGLCLWFGWEGTHYTVLPDPVPETRMERFFMLSIGQVTMWPFVTIVFGTVAGLGGAALAGKRRAAANENPLEPAG